ncbi:MAG: SDR family NAD(P)-dependent oxidoreductase [Anaerolineae bacterium]|nr:SDR family NAD(P)-dependent oxidoreductase [Anaerolineae bacterium]
MAGYPSYPDLKGQVAVISGASGNLGGAVIRRLHTEGVKLALLNRNDDSLQARLVEMGIAADVLVVNGIDLTRNADVDSAVAAVLRSAGRIDILLNLTGGFRSDGPVHESDEATLDALIDLNVKTMFLLSSAVARQMAAQGKGGRIVNVAARAGLRGEPGIGMYSAVKAAVLRLTEAMAAELMPHHINVNAVLPSTLDTPQNRAADPDADFSRWVAPESMADVIAFLISDAARDISGALIPVYGRA